MRYMARDAALVAYLDGLRIVTVAGVLREVYGLEVWTGADERNLAAVLRERGLNRCKARVNGRSCWAFVNPSIPYAGVPVRRPGMPE